MESKLSEQQNAWRSAGQRFLWSLATLLLCLSVGLLIPPAVPTRADSWVIECADCAKTFRDMGDRSMQLDADGYPHIAYGEDHLYYAWQDWAGWHSVTADRTSNSGKFASLALDGEGDPHISYFDSANRDLRYAHYDGHCWRTETVDSSGEVGMYTSIDVDSAGHPHISYCSGYYAFTWNCSEVKYAWHDGIAWQVETVDTGLSSESGGHTSMALDAEGTPHISYFDHWNGTVKYASKDATGWRTEVLPTGFEYFRGTSTSLAVDANGYPHIGFRIAYPAYNVMYAHLDATGWHVEVVDADVETWQDYISLALDEIGQPRISYGGSAGLNYARRNDAGWHTELVDAVAGLFNSLAMDGDGYPHISHYDSLLSDGNGSGDLKYSYLDAEGWHTETVDTGRIVGEHTSLALDEDGYPHISYSANYYPLGEIRYAYQDIAGWHVAIIEAGLDYLCGYTSLALDQSGYPHISYRDGGFDGVNVKYAYLDDAGWHTEIVGTEGHTGEYTSLALDGNGYPHIAYLGDYLTYALKYVYKDATGWHQETVDTEPVSHISLALSHSNSVHISYYVGSPHGELKHAFRDAAGWHVEVVDVGLGDYGGHTSLVLDSNDHPHISYNDGTNGALKYAQQDGSSWQTEAVATEGSAGYTSLRLDTEGYAYISYNDGYPDYVLKYAYQDATGWHIEEVDSKGQVGEFCSLALDLEGYPHISYYDSIDGELRYAHYSTTGPYFVYLPSIWIAASR